MSRSFGCHLFRTLNIFGEQPTHLRKAREKDAALSKPSSKAMALIGEDEFNIRSFASSAFFRPTNDA